MAKLPGAVNAGVMPQPRVSPWEQLLIGLIGSAPSMAMQYFGQMRPEAQERQRQLGVMRAQDTAGMGELQSMLGLSKQPGVEGDVLSNFLTGAGLAPAAPQGLNDRTGLSAVPKGLDQTKLQALQTTPGAVAALAERGRGVQESGLRTAATRENIAASQAQRQLATNQDVRESELQPFKVSTLEFEQTLQPGIKQLQDLDILYKQAMLSNERLQASVYQQQLTDATSAMRERAYGFVAGLRDRNMQMVTEIATRFSTSPVEATQIFAEMAPLYGLDVDVPKLADAYFNAITTGQDPEQLRAFLDVNPARLTGHVLKVSPADIDRVLTHVESGGDLSDYWNDTLALIESSFKDRAQRDQKIAQLKAFFEATSSYYKLDETFNVPGAPDYWGGIFKKMLSEARAARGLPSQTNAALVDWAHKNPAGR